MAQINISSGQGITQAIASQLGMSKDDCKKVGLAKWQQVTTLVNENNAQNKNQNKPSIFNGGNNVNNINKQENWKNNFVVQSNSTIEIEESFWQKIKNILGFGAAKAPEEVSEQTSEQAVTGTGQSSEPAALSKFETMEAKASKLSPSEALVSNKREDGVEMVDDEWRQMANSGDPKTGERYQELVKQFGAEYTQQVDEKFGNGDGILTYDEFKAHQAADIPQDADEETIQEMNKTISTAFKRLDLNKDGKIDKEEITSFLAAMDYDDKGNVNGNIAINDFYRDSIQLGAAGEHNLDGRLKYVYNSFFGKKAE